MSDLQCVKYKMSKKKSFLNINIAMCPKNDMMYCLLFYIPLDKNSLYNYVHIYIYPCYNIISFLVKKMFILHNGITLIMKMIFEHILEYHHSCIISRHL